MSFIEKHKVYDIITIGIRPWGSNVKNFYKYNNNRLRGLTKTTNHEQLTISLDENDTLCSRTYTIREDYSQRVLRRIRLNLSPPRSKPRMRRNTISPFPPAAIDPWELGDGTIRGRPYVYYMTTTPTQPRNYSWRIPFYLSPDLLNETKQRTNFVGCK